MLLHTALNGNDLAMNLPVIKDVLNGNCPQYFPELEGKKGVLFSNTVLSEFIKEEYLHDKFALTQNSNRSIRTMSSGEQKKALLKYLLLKNPDFIILDNPFDALDVKSVKELKEHLQKLSKRLTIIQIFKRRNDLLAFIKQGVRVEKGEIIDVCKIDEFLKRYYSDSKAQLIGEIPPAHNTFELETDELIRFSSVNVRYDEKTILNSISWRIRAGEFWQLKGPNGSGKTTILSMINGDNTKAYGQDIELFGKKKGSGENIWELKQKIGYCTPSMVELFSRRHTAEQMIVSGFLDSIGLYAKPSLKQVKLAEKWLQLLGIYEEKNRPFIELPQIKQRLVLIARAMVKHPPLLILDEPSNGLDDANASVVSALINKMADESRTAIIYVSHRTEPDLKPQFVYELIPDENGSTGTVRADL